jgi:hypothetical protein
MHPAVAILVVFLFGALVFWAALALVDWLQKGKKKNFPSLDSSGDEPYTDKTGADAE